MGCRQYLQKRYVTACPDPCIGKPFATLPLLACQAYRGVRLPICSHLGLYGCARNAKGTTLFMQRTHSPGACRAIPLTLCGLTWQFLFLRFPFIRQTSSS